MRLSSLFDDVDLSARIHEAEEAARERIGRLTPMQRRVLEQMVTGVPNKVAAYNLGISVRTGENHRQAIMNRVGCKNILALARLTVVAGL